MSHHNSQLAQATPATSPICTATTDIEFVLLLSSLNDDMPTVNSKLTKGRLGWYAPLLVMRNIAHV